MVLQRNRTNGRYVHLYIFYGDLLWEIGSHNYRDFAVPPLPSPSQKPRKVSGVIPVWVQRPKNQGNGINLSSRTEENECSSSRQARKNKSSPSLFILVRPSQIWLMPKDIGESTLHYRFTDPNANLIRKQFHRHTQTKSLIWALGGSVELTNKINHLFN